jgi:hypothetical protein
MGDDSHRDQIETRHDLSGRVRARVDAAEQLLGQSAEGVAAAAERVWQARLQAEQAQRTIRLAQAHIARTRERAARAKDRELAAHLRGGGVANGRCRVAGAVGPPGSGGPSTGAGRSRSGVG